MPLLETRTLRLLFPLLLLVLLLLGGCLEREESIEIAADGSVKVTHELRGDGGDLDGGAASLPMSAPFAVERFIREKENGDEEHVVVAKIGYANVSEMPESFADPDDPKASKALRFTTKLITEEREDGTHYIFIRRYEPRSWATFSYHRNREIPEEVQEIMNSGPITELDTDDRQRVLVALGNYERRKNHVWASQALEAFELDESLRLLAELAVNRAIDRYFSERLTLPHLERLVHLPEPEIVEEAARIEHDLIHVALDAATERLELDADARASFEEELGLARHEFMVNEDLSDENFTVNVAMPGRLIEDNADSVRGSTATWRFHGNHLRDREHVLVAHSVVSK